MLATLLPVVEIDLAPGPPLVPVPRITLTAGLGLPAVSRARTSPLLPVPRRSTYARRPAGTQGRPADSPAAHPVA
jgi:hypothetical protein